MKFGNIEVLFCLFVSLAFKFCVFSLKVTQPSHVNCAVALPPTGSLVCFVVHTKSCDLSTAESREDDYSTDHGSV